MYRKKPALSFLLFLSLAIVLSGVSLATNVDIHPDGDNPGGSIPEAIPTVAHLTVSGSASEGAVLTAGYTFHSATGHGESGSDIVWQSASAANGPYTAIAGAAGASYTLKSSDAGQYIRFAVTPKTAAQTGAVTYSASVGPIVPGAVNPPLPASPSPTPAEEVITIVPEVTDGVASATADDAAVDKAIEDGTNVVVIVMDTEEEITEAAVTISANSVDAVVSAENSLVVSTPIAEIAFDLDALKAMAESAEGAHIVISAAMAEPSGLSDESLAAIGDHPVYELSVNVNGVPIHDFGGGYVSVTLPYILRSGESEDQIIIYYIDSNGGLVTIRNCSYHAVTRTVSFVTNHFSTFAIAVNAVTFTDVTGSWYKPYVDFVSARGIFAGVGKERFSPNGTMTRAMFAQALANLEGVDVSAYKASAFSDVKADDWYSPAIAWAYECGIVNGTGGGKFSPGTNITREQMAKMLYDYMNYKGIDLPAVTSGQFNDAKDVSSWAQDAVAYMRNASVIAGTGNNNYAPKAAASRAEVATIFANFVRQFVNN